MNITSVKQIEIGYKVTYENGRVSDIPIAPDNSDYIAVTEWLNKEGNSFSELWTEEELRINLVSEIKVEANSRIVAAYPEWKQRNHMAAVADIHNNELAALKAGTDYVLTADDLAVITSAKSCKAAIEAIRTKSDELETSLDSMTQEQLEAFDPTDDSNWI